jgi:hypothetical protein
MNIDRLKHQLEGSKETKQVNLTVKGPGEKVKHLSMEIGEKTLCSEVFSSTGIHKLYGIPPSHQMLSLGGQLLQPQTPLQRYSIENGTCIQLSIKGLGGGKDDVSDTGI